MDSHRVHRPDDDGGEVPIKREIRLITALLLLLAPIQALAGAEDSTRTLVPAGTATIGADPAQLDEQLKDTGAKPDWYMDETPQKKVDVKAFMIDVTEVTNRRYKQVFANHQYPANLADHPVVNVTWAKADEFCRKSGGHLPTQAQWERSARGDDGRVYPWGDEFEPDAAVYLASSSGGSKLKVGSFEREESGSTLLGGTSKVASIAKGKSPFGLYDMAGNAWEWVDGWYDKGKQLRLLKGGSWLTPRASLRASARLGDVGEARFNDYGFRCVYDIK